MQWLKLQAAKQYSTTTWNSIIWKVKWRIYTHIFSARLRLPGNRVITIWQFWQHRLLQMLLHDLRTTLGKLALLRWQTAEEVIESGDVHRVLLNLLQAETEVGAQKEERAIKVHLVERDHQVIDTAVSKVIQCLLLAASQEWIRITPREWIKYLSAAKKSR